MRRGTFKGFIAIGAALIAFQSLTAAAASIPFYTVKFVCGTQQPVTSLNAPAEPPVKPGNYATVINVEALTSQAAALGLVSVAGNSRPSGELPVLNLTQFSTADITCADIAKVVGTSAASFITGFLNIEAKGQIKVTAVYTSQGCTFSPLIRPICNGATNIDVVPQNIVVLPVEE